MLPTPRTGSKWAAPKKTACTATVAAAPSRARKPRITIPRNTISSTMGAATTAVIASAITYARSASMSETRSVLLVSGMSQARIKAATAIWTTSAAIQMSGPQPTSLQRNRSPTSALSRRVPHLRLTYQHHTTDGPYATVVSIATYTSSGQSNLVSTSINNRPHTSDARRMASAPPAALSGSDGCGAGGGANVTGAGMNSVGGAQSRPSK
jgi:hypothetical protein